MELWWNMQAADRLTHEQRCQGQYEQYAIIYRPSTKNPDLPDKPVTFFNTLMDILNAHVEPVNMLLTMFSMDSQEKLMR